MPNPRKRLLSIACGTAAISVTLALAVLHKTDTSAPVPEARNTGQASAAPNSRRPDPVTGKIADSDDSVPTLPMDDTVDDVHIDGAIEVDMNGNLVYNRDLRRFLDFFIGLTRSEADDQALAARLDHVMEVKGVPEHIRDEVISILENYLAYRMEANRLADNAGDEPPELRRTLDALHSLRHRYLGQDVADGFFAAEEAQIRSTLDQRQIIENDGLTEAQRRQAIAALESQLPEHVQAVRERSRRLADVRQQVQGLQAQGAGPEAIHAVRSQAYGKEAAARLARLDEQRQQWRQRFADYQYQKTAIDKNEGLTPEDRREAIEKLREEVFDSPQERRRAKVLDETGMNDDSPAAN